MANSQSAKRKLQGAKTPVTVINAIGDSALVQYIDDGVLQRKFVPTTEVLQGVVSDQVLLQGIPYGYPWEEISTEFNVQMFANELHKADVWTVDDALKYPHKVSAALRATLSENLKAVLELAMSEKKGVRNG